MRPPAQAFAGARLSAQGTETHPGRLLRIFANAQAIQDLTIAACPDPLMGWHAGRIMGDQADRLATDRLAESQ